MELFKAELGKSWRRPTLELTIALLALIGAGTITDDVYLSSLDRLDKELFRRISYTTVVSFQQLELLMGLLCSILASLSFARDYEQGLLQTLMSLPISRTRLFLAKLLAIVVPLTVVSWVYIGFFLGLNYYFVPITLLKVLLPILFTIFVTLVFYFGIASIISIKIKKTLPSVITSSMIVMALFILQLSSPASLEGYITYTPYLAPIMYLARTFNLRYLNVPIDVHQPAWIFMGLMILYALAFTVIPHLIFTRYFEVRE